jgi:hypothetical protein
MTLAEGATSPSAGVSVCGPHVRAAAGELRELCDRLSTGGPVSAYGVAQVRALLSDGRGPLYQRGSAEDLGAQLRSVLATLDALGPPTAESGTVSS